MKEKRIVQILIILIVLVLAGGALSVVLLSRNVNGAAPVEQEAEGEKILLLSDVTTCKPFQEVPVWSGDGLKMGSPKEYGDGVYIIGVNGVTLEDYQNYLGTLESAGFTKHSDNGKDGMDGYVYEASFTKGNITVTLSYAVNLERAYLSAAQDLPLSDHLNYSDSYMEGVTADAKTTVHMLELYDFGNSFVIQLKNGHFLIHDGAKKNDAPYLLDYLENLTPAGKKPVIEAWFISHPHADHYGALSAIATNPEWANRILVEGIYFTAPGTEILNTWQSAENGVDLSIWYIMNANQSLRTTDGARPAVYRSQLGQRYYFCDITIDVAFTLEQFYDFSTMKDVNSFSSWYMHTIEGQRFLIAGDANATAAQQIMKHYDKEYFDMEIMAVFHHGCNVYDYFTDYCTVDTLLYTMWRLGSLHTGDAYELADENAHLRESAKESYCWGDGTVVLTFPYNLGGAKIMPPCDWRYDDGKPIRKLQTL